MEGGRITIRGNTFCIRTFLETSIWLWVRKEMHILIKQNHATKLVKIILRRKILAWVHRFPWIGFLVRFMVGSLCTATEPRSHSFWDHLSVGLFPFLPLLFGQYSKGKNFSSDKNKKKGKEEADSHPDFVLLFPNVPPLQWPLKCWVYDISPSKGTMDWWNNQVKNDFNVPASPQSTQKVYTEIHGSLQSIWCRDNPGQIVF